MSIVGSWRTAKKGFKKIDPVGQKAAVCLAVLPAMYFVAGVLEICQGKYAEGVRDMAPLVITTGVAYRFLTREL
jgi:hypothetical protein